MDTVDELVAIDAIRNLKARYWYYMDMKDWDNLLDVFTPDATWDARHERDFAAGQPLQPLPPAEDAVAAGDPSVAVTGQGCVDFMRSNVENWVTFHVGGAPVITIIDEENASAIWPIFDYLNWGEPFKGYAHYHDTYRKVQGEWRISSILLTRIASDGAYPQSPLSPSESSE
jgi:hypothetical protein